MPACCEFPAQRAEQEDGSGCGREAQEARELLARDEEPGGEGQYAAREAREMRTWRWYSKGLFALLVAAFAYWVWPTPWTGYREVENYTESNRFDIADKTDTTRDVVLLRRNRITGCIQRNDCLVWQNPGYSAFSEGAQQEIRDFAQPYFGRLYTEEADTARDFVVEHFRQRHPEWDSGEVARELEILVPPPQNYWYTLH